MIFRDDPDVPERENPLYKGECVFVTTFIIGLVILLGGAALYGRFCEKVFGPDDRKTPAYTKEDGVDFVPMRGWKNSLINLLNIAGTGPILGPIQGILFGPIAFLTIPIGNVIGGAMHDYFSGMICLRDGGTQMPEMIRRYSTKGIYKFYNVFVCVLLLLVATAVVTATPMHQAPWWQQSAAAPWMLRLLHSLGPSVPPSWRMPEIQGQQPLRTPFLIAACACYTRI